MVKAGFKPVSGSRSPPAAPPGRLGALKDGAGNAFSTGAYSPANAGHWAGSAPATLAAALDRLADVVSNAGATPIP